jgi:hypothetical protein
MEKQATWADWWASKTMRLQAYATALFAAAIPMVVMLDPAQLAAFGLSEKSIAVIVLVLGILKNAKDAANRTTTETPLAGRAKQP